ncbi:MAG TPA: ECF transporter S component [bacterium]|nr:ECF transporter S component [bacterium]
MGRAQRSVVVGMFAAIAFILMVVVQLPLLPSAPYLTYDPSDTVALLAGIRYGPAAGVLVVLIKDLLFLLFRAKGPFGPAADLIAAATFVAVTAWVYGHGAGRFIPRLLLAALVGTAARVLVMIPANFFILALQFGMPPAKVARLLWPAIIPFNALKAAINAAIALALAEPVARVAGSRLDSAPADRR